MEEKASVCFGRNDKFVAMLTNDKFAVVLTAGQIRLREGAQRFLRAFFCLTLVGSLPFFIWGWRGMLRG